MDATAHERIDVSDVRGRASFRVVFDDGSRSEALEVPSTSPSAKTGAPRSSPKTTPAPGGGSYGFVPDGVLARLVGEAFSVRCQALGGGCLRSRR
jgi:hypothetical protein